MLQEALSNIRQHSGAATVRVDLIEDDDGVCMEIRDDGHGFDPERSSPTRTARAGSASSGCASGCGCSAGRLELESIAGGPTVVRAVLPPWNGYATILIGVPTGTSSFSRRIASFATRTQPCETACPSSDGVFVPWMPTMPPPGHSLSFE